MSTNVVMPKMGESITEGTILVWHKEVGDSIAKDETLLDIGTDKVDSEIPSPASGVIESIHFKVNDTVPVGEVIAVISGSGKANDKAANPDVLDTEKEEKKPKTRIPQVKKTLKPRDSTIFYTPLVRSIAEAESIPLSDLSKINGTGSNNRVTKKDILKYIDDLGSTRNTDSISIESADRVRKRIAERMLESQKISAHVYTTAEVDVTNLVDIRRKNNERYVDAHDIKITYTPMIVHACKKALQEFPLINSSFDGEEIHYHRSLDIGLAVALENNNLVVPVIKNTEEMNFLGISRQASRLASDARNGNLSPDDISGSTFTVTNPGMFGGLFGMGIINQPNVAILTVGSFQKRPIVRETQHGDSIVIRNMCYLTLGYDHRIIDGVYGTKFLMRVIDLIEKTDESILEL